MPLLTSRCRGTLQQGRSLRLELTPEAQISVTFPDEATRPAIIVDADQAYSTCSVSIGVTYGQIGPLGGPWPTCLWVLAAVRGQFRLLSG